MNFIWNIPLLLLKKRERFIYWNAYNSTVEELLLIYIQYLTTTGITKSISFTVINTGNVIVREDFTIKL